MNNNQDRINALLISRLETIERAQKHLHELRADPKKFRMCVWPPRDTDTDMIFQAVIDLARSCAESTTVSDRERELQDALVLAKERIKAVRMQIGRKDVGWHQSMFREILADIVRTLDSTNA